MTEYREGEREIEEATIEDIVVRQTSDGVEYKELVKTGENMDKEVSGEQMGSATTW